ncbi:MAG: DNA polymerase III subunit beta [Gemmatimonadales bacterium]|nr:DNA polymerase III subunit beta [Planctomycetota bacterium]
MQFTCDRARLAEIAGLVAQAAAGKSTKKVFECMRLSADADKGLELASTDLEVAVCYRFPEVRVDEAGVEVIPAKLFSDTLHSISDETISVVSSNRKLTVQTDGGFFELEGEDPTEFPEIPGFPAEATAQVGAQDLRTLVRKTIFATAREATRFALNGVRVTTGGGRMTFVATDGRRLAVLGKTIEGGPAAADGPGVSVILGVKGLQQFEKAAAAVDGAVDLAVSERFAALKTPLAEVTIRVVDGTFPEHKEIVPEQCERTATIPVERLRNCLNQVSKFASVETQSVVLHFKPDQLVISAAGGDGRAEVNLGIEYSGPEERIGFNPAYLIEGLKAMDADAVEFGFNGPNSAARLVDRATGSDVDQSPADDFTYVVMPVIID